MLNLSYSTLYQLRKDGEVIHTRNDVCLGNFLRKRLANDGRISFNDFDRECSFDFLDLYLRVPELDYRHKAERFLWEFTIPKMPQRVKDALTFESYSQAQLDELYEIWSGTPDVHDRMEKYNKKGDAWWKVTFDLSKIGINDLYLAFVLLRYPQEACNFVERFIDAGDLSEQAFILTHKDGDIHYDHSFIGFGLIVKLESMITRSVPFDWQYKFQWPERYKNDPPLITLEAFNHKRNITGDVSPKVVTDIEGCHIV